MKNKRSVHSKSCRKVVLASMISFGKSVVAALVLVTAHTSLAQDSTRTTLQVLPRAHYGGYFPFSGSLLNHNPVVDVNVFYERSSVGFFVFQSVDLKDRHSYVNYFQPGVFYKLSLHEKFRVRAFFGYIFNQTRGFRDNDSDYYTALSTYWDLSKHVSLSSTTLFYDYNINRKLANRIVATISYPRFKAEMFVWDRTVFAEKKHALSASVALTVPVWELNDKARVTITGAYLRYLTEYRPSYALDDGFIATLGVPIDIKP